VGGALGRPVRGSPRDPPKDPEEEVPLLAIDTYLERILASVRPGPVVDVPLAKAWGLVAASDVRATADLPPFRSSAMDGYAVRSADVSGANEAAPAALGVTGEVRMGAPTALSVEPGAAVVVPTGGVVPDGADAVIPVELTARDGGRVLVFRAVPANKHVRPAGEDVKAGDIIVGAGRRLRAPDLGVLAASGYATATVHRPVRVGIVSTGDELVRPGRALGEAQIYDSNAFTLIGAVRDAGLEPVDGGPATDEPGSLVAALDAIADEVDAFVCSGGVSMGERDPVKRAFEDGSDIAFANVAMQPGRPQAFGSWRGKPFFGLPGNPISVFVSFEAFVRPALMKMAGRTDARPTVDAVLEGELEAPKTRGRFARVRVRRDGGRFIATPEGGHQSNLLATFARADGLTFVAAGTRIGQGQTCRVTLIRDV
jgi:molybdopterin molybdotransferase